MASIDLTARFRRRVRRSYALAVAGVPILSFAPFAFAHTTPETTGLSPLFLGSMMLAVGTILLFASLTLRLAAFMEQHSTLDPGTLRGE